MIIKNSVSKKGCGENLLIQDLLLTIVWLYIYCLGLTGNKIIDFSIINPINANNYLYIGVIGMFIFIQIILMGAIIV